MADGRNRHSGHGISWASCMMQVDRNLPSCIMQVESAYALRMLGKTYDSQVCSAARALELVGERWTLLIVRDALFAGATRYGDFQKGLGLATNILKARL